MIKDWLQNATVRRFLILLLFCLILFSMGSMLHMILLLFLVTYVMNRLQHFITGGLNRLFKINYKVVVILLYMIVIAVIVLGISRYSPRIVDQVVQLTNEIMKFLDSADGDNFASKIAGYLQSFDIKNYTNDALKYIFALSKWLEFILLVIILSLFFLLQKQEISKFTSKFKTSKIGWFYTEVAYLGDKFVSSFGKVIEAQLLIAVFNTVLTMLGLWILGYPYLFALTILVFMLSLVPVAGVIISLVPLCLIGYQMGGLKLSIIVIIMIIIIHALETYFLNPKLMAHKTKLPMFYTFIVLILSQHFLGIWGLIIGIPIFVFLLDILDVNKMEKTEEPVRVETKL
ncbi:AI-2E family transporter [Paenibacillus sp. SZ31]|uniref:AI-2E family transporter n=3 Tax=Paenibacillus TaxID=44249 RepID=A0A1R1BLB8_PAEAM|nr:MULTISPECIES: AI-2E family transporter [Paenibacillus]NMI06709.1 AI-2E family transporter [Paenibacillus sp. SZ31]OMF10676.1 AI-2E family transporter [Paenibacillus amylolyticus]